MWYNIEEGKRNGNAYCLSRRAWPDEDYFDSDRKHPDQPDEDNKQTSSGCPR